MCKLEELSLSDDHRAVLVDGVWNELSDRIENVAFVLPKCQSCPKESFLHCLIEPSVVTRKAICEMIEGAKLFTEAGNAPMPQVGALFEMYQKAHAPKPVDALQEPNHSEPDASSVEPKKKY